MKARSVPLVPGGCWRAHISANMGVWPADNIRKYISCTSVPALTMLAGSAGVVRLEVLDCPEESDEVVAKSGEGCVAACAEKSTDGICFMAMIHTDAASAVAYLASTLVSGRYPVECGLANPVAAPEVVPPLPLFSVHSAGPGGGCSTGPSPPAAACSPGGEPVGGATGGGGGGETR